MDSRKKSSFCWKHFDKVDRDISRCKLCSKLLKTCGNTTNMMKHLCSAHSIDLSTKDFPPRLSVKAAEANKRREKSKELKASDTIMEVKKDNDDSVVCHSYKIVDNSARTTKTVTVSASKQQKQAQPAKIKREIPVDVDINHIEEPFDFVGDLTSSYLTEPDEASMHQGSSSAAEAALLNLNKTLERHLTTFKKIVVQQNQNSQKKLKLMSFYDYVDTLLEKLPEDTIQSLSKNFLDEIHRAIQNQREIENSGNC